ncbi:MAG: PKD domain-containing protein, partial [Caldisericia bacterium]|nr:PKD domain-containing protein [Caldisericia bacterium]
GNYEILYVYWLLDFDGTFTLSKAVDTNGDGVFGDGNTIVNVGDTLTYQLNWEYLTGVCQIHDGYIYDSIPLGTTYITGSAIPTVSLEYSTNCGSHWITGEPPTNVPGGTMLRWVVPTGSSPTSLTVQFSVLVVDPNITAVNNGVIFSHRDDDGNFLPSNTISNTTVTCEGCPECPECPDCPECPEINNPHLEIIKTADQMHYYKNDLFTFKAKVGNVGRKTATNVTLTDNFPREMEIVGSRPKGIMSNGKWSYNVGTLTPGQGRIVDFIFRLKTGISLGEKPLALTNLITASSEETDSVTDNATIVVRNHTATEELSIFTSWKGIDTKTFNGETGEEVTLKIIMDGGSSPYDIVINWGDGEVNKFFDVPSQETKTSTHTYTSPGNYEVEIKATDQFGKTTFSRTILHIK